MGVGRRRRRFHRRCCPEISRNYLSLSCVSALCLFPSNRSALLSSINRHLHTVSRPPKLATAPASSSTTREYTDSCVGLRLVEKSKLCLNKSGEKNVAFSLPLAPRFDFQSRFAHSHVFGATPPRSLSRSGTINTRGETGPDHQHELDRGAAPPGGERWLGRPTRPDSNSKYRQAALAFAQNSLENS